MRRDLTSPVPPPVRRGDPAGRPRVRAPVASHPLSVHREGAGGEVQRRLAIIVPMKPLSEAKSRLSATLDAPSRAALCLLMLRRVLRATHGHPLIHARYVVGGDDQVRRLAEEESASWVADAMGTLNAAVRLGAHTAWDRGADAVLVLPGDLALVAPEDVAALINASWGLRRAAISAAARDGGTNALLTPRGMLVGPHFGPGSFQRHLAAMRAANVPVEVVDRPGLAFDLDTDVDLERLRAMEPGLEAALEPWRRMLAKDVATARRPP